ncbi:unnamed protein product [Prorocentrum cordatum]|uniref:Uncharacterized protein n=1 Tax=Prorocentrum cordatum TaxID=2364126 RepID=A0ABN9Y4L7_9DINO|nr:unnamed protein product [Polarella glacialis]
MEAWGGRPVLCVADNENARIWRTKRRAGNRLARYALRVLQLAETRGNFHIVAAGIWTKRSLSTDLTTRAAQRCSKQQMGRRGLLEILLLERWRALFVELEQGGPLVLPGKRQEKGGASRGSWRGGARGRRRRPARCPSCWRAWRCACGERVAPATPERRSRGEPGPRSRATDGPAKLGGPA